MKVERTLTAVHLGSGPVAEAMLRVIMSERVLKLLMFLCGKVVGMRVDQISDW